MLKKAIPAMKGDFEIVSMSRTNYYEVVAKLHVIVIVNTLKVNTSMVDQK